MMDNGFSESELDSLMRGEGNDSGKMCRKCFGNYSRAATLYDTLKTCLSNFVDAVTELQEDTEPTPAKRPCRSSSCTTLPALATPMHSSSATSSPPITVSSYNYYHINKINTIIIII